jgi:hypothetical protein
MIVDKDGRVAGSIDLAALAQLYAQTDDDDLKAHYREVAADSGVELDSADVPEAEPEPAVADLDELRAEAEALGVKVDGRWGEQRLRDEIAAYEDKGEI